METKDDDDTVSVMVWFEDIDLDAVNAMAEKNIGYTQADIQCAEDEIPVIDESVFDLQGTAYTSAINSYKESTKEERLEVLEMQNKLIMEQRKLKSSKYYEYNALQESNANINKKSITYTSFFSCYICRTNTIRDI